MTEILVTCTDCGTTLKVSGESPDGRFVRCPQCTTIFIATKLERTPSAGSSGPRLTCTDCGAIQYAVQPIAGGKFVRCMECGSVFRVPGPPVMAPAARLPAPVESPRPAAVPPRFPLPVATFLDDIPENASAQPANLRARAGSPNRRAGSREDVLDEAGDEEHSRLARRRRKPAKSTNIWVPAAVIGAIAAATVLIIVGMAVLLKPSDKEQNNPLAMVLGPRGPADPGGQSPATSPKAGIPAFPNMGQPPAQLPPGGSGQNPPGIPNGPGVPLPPGNGQARPMMPRNPNSGGGNSQPPRQLPGNPAGPGNPEGRIAPNQPPGPLQGFQPPADSLPGGMARRFQRPQPQESQPAPGRLLPGILDTWLQDFEIARREAARQNKDVLILFDGSDWCGYSMRLASDFFHRQECNQKILEFFMPVFVDFPRHNAASARVQSPARNEKLARQFGVESYPTVVLTDAQGQAYGVADGYNGGGGDAYWQRLMQLRADRATRDDLLKDVAAADGAEKLEAAAKVVAFLEKKQLIVFYRSQLADWLKLARNLDAKNTSGHLEVFFEALWISEARNVDLEDVAQLKKLLGALVSFKKECRFKDANRAARLHVVAAGLLLKVGAVDAAEKFLVDALDYKPTDPKLLAFLKKVVGGPRQSSGTGFVVSANGHIMTNSHVIHGHGRLQVFLPRVKDPVPAQLVAEDPERDMAIIRISLPAGLRLTPLSVVSERKVNRGESAAALGYPLTDTTGSGLKLTTGVISALPEPGTNMMYLLDIKINPGNSGGPLCDTSGNVIGMVSMKTFSDSQRDSYGMALPASDLLGFLKRNIKSYKPLAKKTTKKQWDEIDGMISSSVVMIHNTTGVE